MRTLILGAGGIGGYFGGRLAASGRDVTFLVRPARAEKLEADGLVIESPCGDARIDAQIITKAEDPFDLVMLSCKAYDLDTSMAAVAPAVGPATTILPLLNGLAHLDRLDEKFGAERVLGGLAHISVALGPEGTVQHHNKLHKITFGAREPFQADRCDVLDTFFADGPFDVRRSKNVMQEMWEKFMFITAAAAINCLMRADLAAILAAEDGARLTQQMLEECEAVAAASGFPIGDKARGWARSFLTERGSSFKASMLRDLEAGAKVEAGHLQGDMIRRGAAKGVTTDLLKVAYCNLQAYQAGLS